MSFKDYYYLYISNNNLLTCIYSTRDFEVFLLSMLEEVNSITSVNEYKENTCQTWPDTSR